jgi:hypothetical protein
MQYVKRQPDGRHVCLLSDDELTCLLQCAKDDTDQLRSYQESEWLAWRKDFLSQLESLDLDTFTFNAIARATSDQVESFVLRDGTFMSFRAWSLDVHSGKWQIAGVGFQRMKRLVAAFSTGHRDT